MSDSRVLTPEMVGSAFVPQPESIRVAQHIIAALVAVGVRDVVYSPGSRCAPFAYALAQAESAGELRVHVRVDERGAAFFALGLARGDAAGATPVALIGTSGGAIAEYHAGVAEAFHSHLPLIVISADRPFEMRGVGASQTTFQSGIFASHTLGVWDVPAGDPDVLRVEATVGRAVSCALGARGSMPGPVQVNVALRDPLVPSSWPLPKAPRVHVGRFHRVLPVSVPWEECIDSSLRTVIIAGDDADPAGAVWADLAGVPLCAEPTSGVTLSTNWMPFQQALLHEDSPVFQDIQQVIVTGRPTLSRPVSRVLARSDVRIVVVSQDSQWPDVAGRAAVIVPSLRSPEMTRDINSEWLSRWRECVQQCRERTKTVLFSEAQLSLASVSRLVWNSPVDTLLLGASNSIRAVDLVADSPASSRVVSNRGLAGIDGTISTAFGLARATDAPVRILLGDLAFFHDVSALAVTEPETAPDVHIIVVDDAGGGIFASLEHGREEFSDLYERWFGTTQRASIADLARAYHASYRLIVSESELLEELESPIQGVRITHIQLERPDRVFRRLKAAPDSR